jgi:hypothetical protein
MSTNRLGTILRQFLLFPSPRSARVHALCHPFFYRRINCGGRTRRGTCFGIDTEQPTPKLGSTAPSNKFQGSPPPNPVSEKVAYVAFLPGSQDADPYQTRCRGCDWCPDGWGLNSGTRLRVPLRSAGKGAHFARELLISTTQGSASFEKLLIGTGRGGAGRGGSGKI